MKKIMLSVAVLLVAGSVQAISDTILDKTREYAPSNSVPRIEIINKDKNPIWISVQGGNTWLVPVQVDKSTMYTPLGIDVNKTEYSIYIWTKQPVQKQNVRAKVSQFVQGAPKDYYTIESQYAIKLNDRNKTIYLTWNPAKDKNNPLYPQTGQLWGKTQKSESGVSLKNNVTQADIKKMK